jgi:hypothetical protein
MVCDISTICLFVGKNKAEVWKQVTKPNEEAVGYPNVNKPV